MKLHTQRLTAAGALTPPQPGMTLVRIRCLGGTTPGTFGLQYDGQSIAHFPSPSDGTKGWADYNVMYLIKGTNIPSASVTLNGGIAAVELTYVDTGVVMPGAPPQTVDQFRAIRGARTDGGAVTGNVTFTYDVGPAKPKALSALISASTGRFTFPAQGSFQQSVESTNVQVVSPTELQSDEFPNTNSIVISVVSDGASTSQGVLYY